MKSEEIFRIVALVIVSCVLILTGCSFDRWVEVNEGDYIPVDVGKAHDGLTANPVKSMTIDRENNTMKLAMEDGSIISESFTARPRQDWPSGCPANLGSTRMEVLDLDVNVLTIGQVVFGNPILVRTCPRNPEVVILREDGQIGGSGTACAGNNKCIHLKQEMQ